MWCNVVHFAYPYIIYIPLERQKEVQEHMTMLSIIKVDIVHLMQSFIQNISKFLLPKRWLHHIGTLWFTLPSYNTYVSCIHMTAAPIGRRKLHPPWKRFYPFRLMSTNLAFGFSISIRDTCHNCFKFYCGRIVLILWLALIIHITH